MAKFESVFALKLKHFAFAFEIALNKIASLDQKVEINYLKSVFVQ